MKNLRKPLCVILAAIFILSAFSFSSAASVGETIDCLFTDANSASAVYGASGAAVSFNADEGALRVIASGSAPKASFPVNGLDSSYKYAVITARVNDTDSSGAFEGTIDLMNGGTVVSSSSFCYVRGYKYYSAAAKIDADASVNAVRITFFSGSASGDIMYLYGVSFCKTAEDAAAAAEQNSDAANGPVLSKYTESLLKTDSYVWEDYMIPYWDADLVINEAVYPLKNPDGSISDITLMYSPDRIVSVRSSTLAVEYKEGVDYELVNGKLRILLSGSIPCVKYTNHYFTTQKSNSYYMHEVNMNPYKYVRFEEGQSITRDQIAITYTHSDAWSSYIPENQGESLPNTLYKLEHGQNLKVIYFGDSITNGGNSTNELGMAPYAERWTKMFERKLNSLYPSANITYSNTSVSGGGWDGEDTEYAGYTHVYDSIVWNNPDLVIIALGTNDYQFYSVSDRNPHGKYSPESTNGIVSNVVGTIKSELPNCEIILVAPMISNPECFDPAFLDAYIEGYRDVASEYSGVVIADVNTVHKYLLTKKSYTDMSANNLCHINDMLARLYSHTILKTVTPANLSANYKYTAKNNLNYIVNLNNYFDVEQNEIRAIIADASSRIDAAAGFEDAMAISREARIAILAVKEKKDAVASRTDFENIIFDSAEKIQLFSSLTYVNLSYSTHETAAALKVTGANRDSRSTILFPADKPISASSDKYAVFTYKAPTSNSSGATTAQIYFCAGSVTAPSEDNMIPISIATDGQYHSAVIDLTSYSWWNGIIHRIRIDPFQNCAANDILYISSLCLCGTAEEAADIAELREQLANGTYTGGSSVVRFDNADALSNITPAYVLVYRCDINSDDRIDLKDVAALKKYLTRPNEYAHYAKRSDVNNDTFSDMKDIAFLKKVILGMAPIEQFYEVSPAFNVSFDSDELAANVTPSEKGHYLTLSADIDFDDPAYALLIYKATGTTGDTKIYFGNRVTTLTMQNVTLDVGGEYNSLLLPLPDGFDSGSITLDIENIEIDIDSFGFFELQKAANDYANSALWDRHSPIVYNENVTIEFTNEMMQNITYSNSANYSNDNGVLKLTVSSSKKDPYVYLDLSSLGISADQYKYLIYSYKVPESTSGMAVNGQLFFCSDGCPQPATKANSYFALTKNNNYVDKVIDITHETSFWSGNVIGIRIDFFANANAGDVCYVRSLTFCKTEEDVQTALGN